MLLANYGSDSGSDSEGESAPPPPPQAGPSRTAPSPSVAKATASTSTSTSAVKPKRKGPVKITLDLPKPERSIALEKDEGLSENEGEAEPEREVKKPKLGKGKGSALLGMLPPPKRKLPSTSNSGTSKESSLAVNRSMAAKPPPPPGMPDLTGVKDAPRDEDDDEDGEASRGLGGLLPASIARNKSKAKAEPALDLFGLAEPQPAASIPKKADKPILPPSISSAPLVPDFVPPEPTAEDPYPGYYQLPSGQWQAYDPEYYHSFFADESSSSAVKAKGEDGRVGHHWDEYDTKGANVVDIDVKAGLEAARKEEERKGLMKKPKVTGEEYDYKAIGQTKGLAAQRHQLTSLLNTAFTQREELEERIAQNKKNMRMAGQKYGF